MPVLVPLVVAGEGTLRGHEEVLVTRSLVVLVPRLWAVKRTFGAAVHGVGRQMALQAVVGRMVAAEV